MIHTYTTPPNPQCTVLVIMGSTRAGRLCPQIATWVSQIGQQATGLACELVDLADWHLPFDDEPGIPALGVYAEDHTKAWSRKIAAAGAIVFVTPQYNWGYPAVLKNALDHLFKEWAAKPAMIVSYGGHGGGKCAEQLRQVIGAMKMQAVPTMPGIVITRAMMGGAPVDPGHDFQSHVAAITQGFSELAALLQPASTP